MSTNITMYNDQELPSLSLAWTDDTGALIDFSAGWTFTVKLARSTAPATTLLVKTTGITGSSGSTGSNLVIDWSTTDWAGLEAAVNGSSYVVHVAARRTADSRDRYFRPASPISLTLKAAPGTSAVSPSSYPITVTAASVTLADTGGYFTATDVEGALAEHVTDTVDAHDASAISVLDSGNFFVATDVEAALAETVTKFAPLPGGNGAGKYVVPAGVGGGSATAVDGKLCLVPFRATPGRSLDRIGINVTTLGAGSTIRLGIYPDDGFGYPDVSATPIDYGTVDSSTTGQKLITISYTMTTPVIWLAAVSQGGTPAAWATVATGINWQWADTTTASFAAFNGGYQKTGVTGALGTLTSVGPQSPSGTPMIIVRYV